jgi:organic radical activating enzyme
MAAKIKISEIFYSIQGEGLYVGTPSLFVRAFGCNFTCSGFGMPKGKKSQERFEVDPKEYSEYKTLPLVHTGCDSYASWDPRFKHLSPVLTIPAIVDRIQELLPDKRFGVNKHLILTGGEPLLPGWQKQYPALLDEIYTRDMGLQSLTFETNGTQPLSEELRDVLNARRNHLEVIFSVSSKLSVSGEKWEDAIKPDVVRSYQEVRNSKLYFKWVVGSEDDIQDIERAIKEYDMRDVPVNLMPIGGTDKLYEPNSKTVAEMALSRGWRYSPRLQVDLWKNRWGS